MKASLKLALLLSFTFALIRKICKMQQRFPFTMGDSPEMDEPMMRALVVAVARKSDSLSANPPPARPNLQATGSDSEEDESDIANFSHYENLFANQLLTKCLTAVQGLEEAYNDAAEKGSHAMAVWWAELEREPPEFKSYLNAGTNCGTPIQHLKEYIFNARKNEWLQSAEILKEITPIDFHIKKLGRKLVRITTTLQNHTVILEKAISELSIVWEMELDAKSGSKDGPFSELLNTKGRSNCEASRSSGRRFLCVESVGRSITHGCLKIQKLLTRNKNSIPENQGQPEASPTVVVPKVNNPIPCSSCAKSLPSKHINAESQMEDQQPMPCACPSGSIIVNILPANDGTTTPDAPAPQHIIVEETKDETSSFKSCAIVPTTPPMSDAAPASNANSKTNWLSQSDLADSDSDLCEAVEFLSRGSDIGIFADDFILKHSSDGATEPIITIQNLEFSTAHAEASEPTKKDESSKSSTNANTIPANHSHHRHGHGHRGHVHFEDGIKSGRDPDYLTPLKDFTQNLNGMIQQVTTETRAMELRFYQISLKESWSEGERNGLEIGRVVKDMVGICGNLMNEDMSKVLYAEVKEAALEKLTDLQRVGVKCLRVIQDLNYVVNIERKDFKAIVKYCSNGDGMGGSDVSLNVGPGARI